MNDQDFFLFHRGALDKGGRWTKGFYGISIKLCKMELVEVDFDQQRTFTDLENCNGFPAEGHFYNRKLSVA